MATTTTPRAGASDGHAGGDGPDPERRRLAEVRTSQTPWYRWGPYAENRYFDVAVAYAKADAEDILIRISATNRGPDPAPLHLLPTLWFRNAWSWDQDRRPPARPELRAVDTPTSAQGPDGAGLR